MSPPRQKPNKTLVEQVFENSVATTKAGERPESCTSRNGAGPLRRVKPWLQCSEQTDDQAY